MHVCVSEVVFPGRSGWSSNSLAHTLLSVKAPAHDIITAVCVNTLNPLDKCDATCPYVYVRTVYKYVYVREGLGVPIVLAAAEKIYCIVNMFIATRQLPSHHIGHTHVLPVDMPVMKGFYFFIYPLRDTNIIIFVSATYILQQVTFIFLHNLCIIAVSPVIALSPAVLSVIEHQQLTLPCVLLAGNPLPERQWLHNYGLVSKQTSNSNLNASYFACINWAPNLFSPPTC